MKPREQMLEIMPAAHGVSIHPPDARPGKDFGKPLFALLRARAKIVQVLALTFRTLRRYRSLESAVMAFQPLACASQAVIVRRFVMGERDRTILALKLLPAGTTDDCKRIAAPIEQNNDLLISF